MWFFVVLLVLVMLVYSTQYPNGPSAAEWRTHYYYGAQAYSAFALNIHALQKIPGLLESSDSLSQYSKRRRFPHDEQYDRTQLSSRETGNISQAADGCHQKTRLHWCKKPLISSPSAKISLPQCMAGFQRQVRTLRYDYGIARSHVAYWLGPTLSVVHARRQIKARFSRLMSLYPHLNWLDLQRLMVHVGGDPEQFEHHVARILDGAKTTGLLSCNSPERENKWR